MKNIINKSKEYSKQIGDPYDLFVLSLPSELDYYKDGGKYRLKAAWKAYGKPQNYQEAKFFGLVESLDGKNFVMPSIGYNEENDSYEYLNVGKENEAVAKDIRVWDNDVIPFIKELKHGGYVRVFDESENCWKYAKGVEEFKKGGKPKRERKYKTYEEFRSYLGPDRNSEEAYDLKGAYEDDDVYFDWEDEETKNPGKAHFLDKYKLPNHPTFSTDSKYSNSVTLGGNWSEDESGKPTFETSPYVESQHSLESLLNYFRNNELGVNLKYKGVLYPALLPEAFRQGGLMNVIPEGSLHAHKNHMDLAEKGEVTSKGIPVVSKGEDGEIIQQAEVEREELTVTKQVTDKLESWYDKFYDGSIPLKEKDEIAIKCGKFITKEILFNTDDRVGLISKLLEKM